MEKLSLLSVGGDDATVVAVVRQVAAGAAGHQDFDTGAFVFFQ